LIQVHATKIKKQARVDAESLPGCAEFQTFFRFCCSKSSDKGQTSFDGADLITFDGIPPSWLLLATVQVWTSGMAMKALSRFKATKIGLDLAPSLIGYYLRLPRTGTFDPACWGPIACHNQRVLAHLTASR